MQRQLKVRKQDELVKLNQSLKSMFLKGLDNGTFSAAKTALSDDLSITNGSFGETNSQA